MACPKWSLFMGGLSAFLHLVAVLYCFTGLVGWRTIDAEDADKDDVVDPDAKNDTDVNEHHQLSRGAIAEYTIEMVSDIAMFAASIMMIYGVKKQIAKLMAPWVYLVLITIIVYVVGMFADKSDEEDFIRFAATFVVVAIWYPIYKHYKQLRKPCPAAAAEHGYTHGNVYPCAPAAVYASTTEYVHAAHQPATAPSHE